MTLYVELGLFKSSLKITNDDRDTLLTQALTAASRAVDAHTGRRADGFTLAESATARTYDPSGRTVRSRSGRHKLLIDEIGHATGLTVETGDGTTWSTVTAYRTEPDSALDDGVPIDALIDAGWSGELVRVTARWGWPTVPADVAQATLIQATRLYRRKDNPEGTAGGGEWGTVRLSRIDPDVGALLAHLTLPGIA